MHNTAMYLVHIFITHLKREKTAANSEQMVGENLNVAKKKKMLKLATLPKFLDYCN